MMTRRPGIVAGEVRGQRVLVAREDERDRVDQGAIEIEENGVNAKSASR